MGSTNDIPLFLSRVPLFRILPPSSLEEIARLVYTEKYPAGTRLIRQGEPGDSFYIVRVGEARVTTTSEDGLESFLATLGPGDCLGEMALLTGEPRAANVTLTADTTLYVLYKDAFDQTLERNPTLYRHFTSLLVQRLKGSNLLVEREREREVALSRFLHLDPSASPPRLVGRSRAVQQLLERVGEVAPLDVPLILRGERGVGRELVARVIHQKSSMVQGPFVVATCMPDRRKRSRPVPRERRLRDQTGCNLLGFERDAFQGAAARQIGLLELAHEGTLLIRNAEHLPPSLLALVARARLLGSFRRMGGSRDLPVRVRFILTWTEGEQPEKEEALSRFAQEAGAQTVEVPPLRQRKRDIPLLVDHFITRLDRPVDGETPRLSREALNRLMHYDYPGNVAELESVIKRGILLARGPEIFPEEIHLGVPKVEGRTKFNLLRIPWAHRLLGPADLMGLLRVGVTVALLALILTALWGVELRVAGEPLILLLTWRVWWPLLLLSLIFAGRIWCGVCPVYTIAGITQKWSRKVPIPEFVARWGRWMAILGFFVLVWLENYFHLLNRPRETAFILGGVVLGALLVGFLFQRNAWCRYLCPLGTMAGVYAVASCAEVRANRSLCLSSCTDHLCYKGTTDRPGCPMYQHPLFFQSNMNCRFCFQCVTNCPHGAVQLNLRLPAEEAWTMEERPVWASLFARILLGFVISQFLGEWGPFRERWGSLASWLGLSPVISFTSMLLAPLVLTLGLFAAFDAFTWIRTRLAFRRILEVFGFVGVPLALMGHLAAKLGQALGPSPATLVLFERHFIHWDLTRFLQIFSLLVGTVLSLYLVAKLRHRVRAEAAGGVAWASTMQAIPVLVLGMGLWFLIRA